jgi:hypothetical protein
VPKQKAKYMYSYNDFERLFVRYKLEGVPSGISIQQFCMSNKVPYNLFEKWYKDTRNKIVPVQVLDKDSKASQLEDLNSESHIIASSTPQTPIRILVDIRMSNGIHISQKNLSYQSLKSLVEKLEGLC